MKTHRFRAAAWPALLVCMIVGGYGLGQFVAKLQSADKPIPIVISKETTYFTEPLTKDGEVDFHAAINAYYGQNIKPDENAAIAIWEIGRHDLHQEALTQLYQIWHAERPRNWQPLTVPLLTGPVREKERRLELQFFESLKTPWTAEAYPEIAQWLEANSQAVDAIHQAIKRPKYFVPSVHEPDRPGAGMLNWSPDGPRELGMMLVSRAMLHLGNRQYDAAWDDLIAAARLGRLFGTGITYPELSAGWAIEWMAYDGMLAYLKLAPVTSEHAQSCRKALAVLPSRASFTNVLSVDQRIAVIKYVLSIFQNPNRIRVLGISSGVSLETPLSPDDVAGIGKVDLNAALREVNRRFDHWVTSIRPTQGVERLRMVKVLYNRLELDAPDYPEVLEACRAIQSKKDAEVVGTMLGTLVAYFFLDIYEQMAVTEAWREQQVILIDTGFALAAWHAERGDYPEQLTDLVPKYLAELPRDLFLEGPLNYRRTPEGYVLYSVGPNGKDEEGRNSRRPHGENDDIALKIKRGS